ncbi:hypothetical protein N7U66_09560 [Lacinutrix neustonica]|uniref:Uncharacterized protein n=1 Tax=Lacinutrix neustonica TaxID=2980107 RepID=A0A9E8MXS9_9FLAO|nr:hypothetical protein [Lacinutrix neustonica]WAC03667.1 hypothetical protein N7U66_09560 [Lacinutrix neustonica]
MKYLYCLIIAFISIDSVFSQAQTIDSIISSLQKDQLLFEKVFIHTNKTIYHSDDVIWFKAYVSENNNKPSVKTTILYVNLFTQSGELVDSKNILILNGLGSGQFELKGDLLQGSYYIQAFTNYMQNFGAQNKYIHKLEIVGDLNHETQKSNPIYDVQLFPKEGIC